MDSTNIKQVIVVRTDLRNASGQKVRSGKIAAQVAHASMKVLFDKFIKDPSRSVPGHHTTYSLTVDNDAAEWIEGIFTKICVAVDSEKQLLEIYHKALEKNLPCALIMDAGLTEFYFYLCKKCGDAIYKSGNTENCGYPLCECGEDAEAGDRIPVKTFTCCSIGPAKAELIDDITGKLSLL